MNRKAGKLMAIAAAAMLAAAGLAQGCLESRVHSVTTDSPYSDAVKPLLVLKNEHFGGGYTIPGTKKRTFFAGGEIFNYGGQPAYSPSIRIRIYQHSGAAEDDHYIYMPDISPAKSVTFDETLEVATDYSGSEAILSYQEEGSIKMVVLKPFNENINNSDKNSY